jgi:hypothetical protein
MTSSAKWKVSVALDAGLVEAMETTRGTSLSCGCRKLCHSL